MDLALMHVVDVLEVVLLFVSGPALLAFPFLLARRLKFPLQPLGLFEGASALVALIAVAPASSAEGTWVGYVVLLIVGVAVAAFAGFLTRTAGGAGQWAGLIPAGLCVALAQAAFGASAGWVSIFSSIMTGLFVAWPVFHLSLRFLVQASGRALRQWPFWLADALYLVLALLRWEVGDSGGYVTLDNVLWHYGITGSPVQDFLESLIGKVDPLDVNIVLDGVQLLVWAAIVLWLWRSGPRAAVSAAEGA